MPLSDLTSREAVLQAIAEYDQLGREAFLTRYGFGISRSYLLIYNGHSYDSKAIAGVAYGYQYPERGALSASDFSGGTATVQPILESLGFTVSYESGSTVRPLRRNDSYTRTEVHAIFAPNTSFTPQSGTWGLHGIVAIPNRPGDYVFFVTFGQQQGSHIFEEGITEDGVLTWQSQPRQGLADRQIQQFIAHDDLQHNIYLFLRTTSRTPYTYLGRLRYLDHDPDRERPVWFRWQILDWDLLTNVGEKIGLVIQPASPPSATALNTQGAILTVTAPPLPRPRSQSAPRTFQSRILANDPARDARQRNLGTAGELLVLAFEQERLLAAGRPDLATRVCHIAAVEGDGAGYDIASWNEDGEPRYIEVKTTSGPAETPFYMSVNEVEFAKSHANTYLLYRVYAYDGKANTGSLFIIPGDISQEAELNPTQFRVIFPKR